MLAMMSPISEQDGGGEPALSVDVAYRGLIDDEALRILIWVYCESWSYNEVADTLGISLSACKKRIQRAREKLKKALEENLF